MAKLYRDKIFASHGLPRRFVHDRGPQFHAKFMKELYQILGIQGNYTTAHHPQSNGSTERINQEIEHYLRLFINYHQSDWNECLPLMEFSYNDKVHSSTKLSPFYVDMGRHPYKGTEPYLKSDNVTAQEFVNSMVKIREEASSALKKASEDMKSQYDKHRKDAVEYKPGDKVWLEGSNLKSDRPMKKLGDKRFGPLTVLEKIGDGAYKLEIPLKKDRLVQARTCKTFSRVYSLSIGRVINDHY